uniref:Uncharacterized protein n=1 Tax=Arundo donax TaxID=35708 RepID=A0A0A9B4S6_ARUDO
MSITTLRCAMGSNHIKPQHCKRPGDWNGLQFLCQQVSLPISPQKCITLLVIPFYQIIRNV